MNKDQQRADFEAWARELTPNINLGRYPNEGTYVVTAVERAWRVWQAALTSPQVQALRGALWVATEHNALHFGESHNTVIQGRAALEPMENQP